MYGSGLEDSELFARKRSIKMWFGLDDGNAHALEEVGQSFAVTRERLRQIEHTAKWLKQSTDRCTTFHRRAFSINGAEAVVDDRYPEGKQASNLHTHRKSRFRISLMPAE